MARRIMQRSPVDDGASGIDAQWQREGLFSNLMGSMFRLGLLLCANIRIKQAQALCSTGGAERAACRGGRLSGGRRRRFKLSSPLSGLLSGPAC